MIELNSQIEANSLEKELKEFFLEKLNSKVDLNAKNFQLMDQIRDLHEQISVLKEEVFYKGQQLKCF